MRRVVLIFVFTFFPTVGFAQAVGEEANTAQKQIADPASREDLKKATAEMKKAALAAIRAADKRTKDALDAAEKQHQEDLKQNKTDTSAKVEAVITAGETARLETAKETAKQWKTIKIYGGGATALVVIISLVALARRNKSVEVRVVQPTEKNQNGILVDPDVPTLREYSVRNGNINPVPFQLTLPKEGVIATCEAQLTENSEPLITKVNGLKCFLRWKNRVAAVAKFLVDNNLLGSARKMGVAS